ncbi:MAG: diaminopimelate epimerase, partial [Clostridia bacterium]|nr:diaminopimelate epimerase [Clostridia bacterium]
PVKKFGPYFEKHPLFSGGTNTEFCEIISKKEVVAKVYERGSGETLACGSGACAIVAIGVRRGLFDKGEGVTVRFPRGNLTVTQENDDEIFLFGGAEKSFEGVIEYENKF